MSAVYHIVISRISALLLLLACSGVADALLGTFSLRCGGYSGVSTPLQNDLYATIEYNDFLPHPNPDIEAPDVVCLCMDCLRKSEKEGLEVCFNFSSDYLKAPFGGSLDRFIQHANNPIFASLVKCTEWEIISIGPVIAGTNTRGAMQTVLMDVKQPEYRRFLWTLQRERRPPRQNCWLVHECLFVKNAYQLTI